MSTTDARALFSNLPTLHHINSMMLEEIESRIVEWSNDQMIGEIFAKMGPVLKLYTIYSRNHDNANKLLKTLYSNSSELQEALKHLAEIAHDTRELPSFLIMPIQRVHCSI